jgi:23S rRNA (cytosine1962-C5)-methyltransferase
LFVDRYADVLVVHADSEAILTAWQPALTEQFGEFSVAVAKVHPRQASRERPRELTLWGQPPDEILVHERAARYAIRPRAGLNVGLFLDMREVRSWVRLTAAGRAVLNLFAYTCSFGVVASLGGARRVVNLDLSRAYLDWGQRNYAANGLEASGHDFIYGDAFDWLKRFTKRGQTFELVIVDPPSFGSTRRGAFSVERDYPRLVAAAARTVASGGMLLAATNHASTTGTRFEAWLQAGLDSAGRRGRLERAWHEPAPDFPLIEGRHPYLKVRALTLD